MKNKRDQIYVPPEIFLEKIVIEEDILNTSSLIIIPNQDNEILVENWTQGTDIESTEQDSRW